MTSTKLKKLIQVYGTTSKSLAGKTLAAGPMTAEFVGGNLSAIRFRGIEVLRGISYLVRDEDWGTCKASITRPVIRKSKGRISVNFKGNSQKGTNVLRYLVSIDLTAHKLEFIVTATPDKDFTTNRTGFVVLHPIEGVAGKPLIVSHIDGSKEKSRFPKLINPGQPFFNIRAIEHAPAPGLKAHVLMEGHKFEMEDQRNWGDASYKTYVCSLLDPWPYVLKAGESFTQKITLSISGTAKVQRAKDGVIRLSAPRPNAWLPQLGLSLTEDDAEETLSHILALRELSPRFLLGLYEVGKTPAATLQTYADIALRTGIPFRTEIVLSATKDANTELADVAKAFNSVELIPQAVIVTQAHDLKSFQPTDKRPWGPSYEEMATAARAHFPNAQIGGGMISYFTELNRKRPPLGLFDFLTHSICPIVHDASDAAVMQTLQTLPHIFTSARALMGDAPYHLGPTTIGSRMNPYGKDVAANLLNGRVCLAPNDPRQFGTFAAVWNLGLIAAAALAKLDSVCLGPLCGPRGLLGEDGKPSPTAELFKAVSLFAGKRVYASFTSVVAVMTCGSQVTLVGNSTAEEFFLDIDGERRSLPSYQLTRC